MENIKQKLAVILTTIKQLQQEIEPLNQQVQAAAAKYQEARAKQDEANQNYQNIVQEISRGEQQ
ncbi:hypothetical protein IPD43_29340, partial [Paenibacillus polymyxa]|nr:hypothetical protein [Paenibacillus polymyxa]